MASDSTSPSFMDLPGELCNRIYRFALTESAGVSVTAQGVQEPGLLLVNKKIRKEAAPIFWTEDTIELAISKWHPAAACFLMRKRNALRKEFGDSVDNMDTRFTGDPRPHWRNLLEWLRRHHAGPVVRPGLTADSILQVPHLWHQQQSHLITVMFETVEVMLDKPWSRVEELMLKYRPILAGLEVGWAA